MNKQQFNELKDFAEAFGFTIVKPSLNTFSRGQFAGRNYRWALDHESDTFADAQRGFETLAQVQAYLEEAAELQCFRDAQEEKDFQALIQGLKEGGFLV